MAAMHRATWDMPPSSRSSRATMVSTAKDSPIRRTASATRAGSSASGASGLRVSTRQNPHALVHRSPSTMNVGARVPALGQVRATRLLAHGDEGELAQRALQAHHVVPHGDVRPDPVGLALADVDCVLHAGARQSAHQPHGLAGALAAREEREVLRCGPPRHVVPLGGTAGPRLRRPARHRLHDLLHGHLNPLLGERGDGVAGDAARHDVVAHVGEVGGHVEGEAVHRAAAPDANADRTDLARAARRHAQPHTRIPVEPPCIDHTEVGERIDDHLLETVHVQGGLRGSVGTVAPLQHEQRVPHQLAGSVVRDVTPAVHGDEVRTHRRRVTFEVVGEVRGRSVREDVGVLHQEQMVAPPGSEHGLLDRESLAVRDAPQPADLQCGPSHLRCRRLPRPRSTSRASRGSPSRARGSPPRRRRRTRGGPTPSPGCPRDGWRWTLPRRARR